jgi:hypothetical protein
MLQMLARREADDRKIITSEGRVTLLLISAPRRPDICGSAAQQLVSRKNG